MHLYQPISLKKNNNNKNFKVCTRKLIFFPNTEQMFVHLFGKSTNAFWLDSSRVEPGLSRFSFMGDSSGENSLLIRYQTQSQELMITKYDQISLKKEGIF